MNDWQLVDKLTLKDLYDDNNNSTPYIGNKFKVCADFKNKHKPVLMAFCEDRVTSFSMSKYGLKQAKKWILEKI